MEIIGGNADSGNSSPSQPTTVGPELYKLIVKEYRNIGALDDKIYVELRDGRQLEVWVHTRHVFLYNGESGNKKEKPIVFKVSKWLVNWLAKMAGYKGVKVLKYTKCVEGECIIPLWSYDDREPMVVVVSDEDVPKPIHSGKTYVKDGYLYVADYYYASLVQLPVYDGNCDIEKIKEAIKENWILTYLAAMPYILPHMPKRHIPVVMGPMRSGKTTLLDSLDWDGLRIVGSTAAVRNLLGFHHVLADDAAEDLTIKFEFIGLLNSYFDRAPLMRVSPNSPNKTLYFPLRGALAIATNNPQIMLRSTLDRIAVVYAPKVLRQRLKIDGELLSCLAYMPRIGPIYLQSFKEFWGMGHENTVLTNAVVEGSSMLDLAGDPWLSVLRWLWRELYKIRSEHGWEGAPPQYKLDIKGKDHICIPIPKLVSPIADYTVNVSASIHKDDKVSTTKSISYNAFPIRTPQIELVLRGMDLPAFIHRGRTKYYVCTDDPEALYQMISNILKEPVSQ
ncbi:hypothetical protein TTSV1_gp01 [Thermoproteus tenax spherical virus 1]|uniref:Uncharacterized protein n=1 Tax=Thermoproteus tenax spherical virus 1 TaxID=292639 RepID=Q647G1_9VIRU|nr:hypothetical protein TTSV1_gp01 [Thermoproteus tenax spherical virus 1]AAU25951.1 hypothetical protein [Thermoproteus tenax spherical virus 1]